SRHSLSDHSSLDLLSIFAGPSRKRRRSPMTPVPTLPPVYGALSLVRADLIPKPKRVRDSGYLADVEVDLRETSLRDDVMVRGSDEPHLEQDIDLNIQAEIDECIAYTDALRHRGIVSRVVVEAVDQEESGTSTRALIEVRVERVTLPMMLEDTPKPTQEERDIEWPSRKRRRSPMTSVPTLPLVYGALSLVRADLIPKPKRVKDSGYLADVEVDLRETSLRDDVMVRCSDEPHLEQDIDLNIQAEIDECI
nr:hypothetical protein [Tanacetum cinerariifolium]